MIPLAAFSELLARLHAGPLEDENWQQFFTLLCEYTQTASGFLLCHQKATNCTRILAGGGGNYDPGMQQIYNAHYYASDPYVAPFNRSPRVAVIDSDELIPREQLMRTEFFNEGIAPFGLDHSMLVPFVVNSARIEVMTLWRGAHEGAMSQESKELLAMLIPHLRSALGVRYALEKAGERALRAEAALDAMGPAAFLLDASGSLVHWNAAAERLAARRDGFSIQRHGLVASDASKQEKLRALISFAAAVSGASSSRPGGAMALPRAASDRPLHAIIAPLRLAGQGRCSPAHVLVLITDPDESPALPRETLSVLYGLTSSEVEVANGLLAGRSLEEIADARQVSRGTARTQVKSLLQKTGTRRQGELIRLLLSLPQLPEIEK